MMRFIVFTSFTRPGLHVWREGTQLKLYLEPLRQAGLSPGFHLFDGELGVNLQEKIYCLLFSGIKRAPARSSGSRSRRLGPGPCRARRPWSSAPGDFITG
jgi:hypothetical protein